MTEKDARHGTNAGYIAGCRQDCCKAAHAKYKRDRRARIYLAGGPLEMPARGTHRRVQALMCLGWSMEEISIELGHHRSWCSMMMHHDIVYRDTFDAIGELYERWCMTLPPPGRFRERTRSLARKRGYAPPLAWDDIDADMRPAYGQRRKRQPTVDEATVIRVLSGENLPTTRAEKDEIVRRWVASGRSEKALCQRLGWKDGRYGKRVA